MFKKAVGFKLKKIFLIDNGPSGTENISLPWKDRMVVIAARYCLTAPEGWPLHDI
ncbi:hypothetical protein [Methylobacter luteus]|jgi:hypothetical protein|uniref:hypothetical protein n=1 Tax=Methylobacter luteus TaxID=415 RepID=UPI00041E4726|nr:hypothetical protein [Methylobacter luteus]